MTDERHKKKLIEVAIPLEAINRASAREKSIRHGHPSTLHLWWARRPLAACRAVLFAQLVDDPSEYVDKLLEDPSVRSQAEKDLEIRVAAWGKQTAEAEGNVANLPEPTLEDCAAEIERKRLFKIIEDLVLWENSTNETVLERARAEIRRSCGSEMPPIYDPFSGGGSIPLEAQRLGLEAFGSDLNPVAVMIGKATIEIPPRFWHQTPVHNGGPEKNHYRNAEGLAEDVKYYGQWMREKAWERVGHLYPKVDLPKEYGGGKATVIAWIWARTVPSPDPAYSDAKVPLVSNFLLSSKKGKEVWLEPSIDKSAKAIRFRIRRGGTKAEIEAAKAGTTAGKRQAFQCLISGAALTYDHIRKAGQSGKMGHTLLAVVAEGKGERVHLEPSADQIKIACSAKPDWKPETLLPDNPRDFKTPNYGMTSFGDLFTDRQLVALNTFGDLISRVREKIENDALSNGCSADQVSLRDGGTGAKAYAEAVSVYLGMSVSKLAVFLNSLCRWRSGENKTAPAFGRQAIAMVWDYAEVNPFAGAGGDFQGVVNGASGVLDRLCGFASGKLESHDAQTVAYPPTAVISTDPPYYDNIGYAELSDFFYCWMKPVIRPIFPDSFAVLVAPKTEELVATPYRHGGTEKAEAFFLNGMGRAIANMAQQSSGEYPATIYYAFKQSEVTQEGISSTGWATFLQAVVEAGYSVVGTWPLRTEMATRMIASGTNALASSVVLVCRRKKETVESVSRAEFIRALKRELPPALAELQAANIAPADMPQSAIGPGMGIFSGHATVLEGDDSHMTVKTALELINRELDEYLGGIEGEFDAETRFAISWFEQNGMAAGEYGTANSIAQARGISVDSVRHAGIVESGGGSVRLLRRDELDADWDPVADTHLTIWECCQYLIRTLEEHGEYDAAIMMKRLGPDHAEAAKDLAYCLYDIAGNKRQDAREATSYNGLIAVWSDLTAQAAAISDEQLAQEQFSLKV